MRQVEKIRFGFFSIKRYIPHDRDISLLREARQLFQQYLQNYPGGQWIEEAGGRITELLTKEGEHELGIVSFYLRKGEHKAALARAQRLLDSGFPESIQERARELAREANEALPVTEPGSGS